MFAYKFSSEYSKANGFYGKYFLFRKVGETTWWPGHIIPIIQVYDWIGDTIPSLDTIKDMPLLRAEYPPVNGRNLYSLIHPKYNMAIIKESEKGIPKDNLIHYDNIPLDDPPTKLFGSTGYVESVGWESSRYNTTIEHEIIKLYLAWQEYNNKDND